MLPTLTKRQKAIYDFLLRSIREKGYAPSNHEIGPRFKIASTNMIGAGILDGDRVIVKQQRTAENSEIVCAMI